MDDNSYENGVKLLKKNRVRELYWKILGTRIKNPILRERPKSVYFICKGNICRSPFAARSFKNISEKEGLNSIQPYSAGLDVIRSLPSPEEAIVSANHFGVDLTGHKSRGIDHDKVGAFDMIVGMEWSHFKSLRDLFPQYRRRIFLLPLFDKNEEKGKGAYHLYNIFDPFGRPLNRYRECFERIEICLINLVSEIKMLS